MANAHTETFVVAATAVLATAGHYALQKSFVYVELTVLQPFTFLQLVWATLVGYYFFGGHRTHGRWQAARSLLPVRRISHIAKRSCDDKGKQTQPAAFLRSLRVQIIAAIDVTNATQ